MRAIIREAYGAAFSKMMIMTTAFVAFGWIASLGMGRVAMPKKQKKDVNGSIQEKHAAPVIELTRMGSSQHNSDNASSSEKALSQR